MTYLRHLTLDRDSHHIVYLLDEVWLPRFWPAITALVEEAIAAEDYRGGQVLRAVVHALSVGGPSPEARAVVVRLQEAAAERPYVARVMAGEWGRSGEAWGGVIAC